MTIEEAEEIISLYDKHENTCCSCHMGHPPCSHCIEMPSQEEYDQALLTLRNDDGLGDLNE